MSVKIYHPKGSMCSVCAFMRQDCSGLLFNEMKPTKKYSKENDPTVFVVVICDGFNKT